MIASIHGRIEELARTNKRSTKLLASFKDGYADSWYMAVRESLRPQLDIRYTSRIERPPGSVKGDRLWTQGPRISFEKGHIIYSTPLAYQRWDIAVDRIELACVIVEAKPNDVVRRERDDRKGHANELVDGFVEFELLRPNDGKTQLITYDKLKRTQNEFVEFLMNGIQL